MVNAMQELVEMGHVSFPRLDKESLVFQYFRQQLNWQRGKTTLEEKYRNWRRTFNVKGCCILVRAGLEDDLRPLWMSGAANDGPAAGSSMFFY